MEENNTARVVTGEDNAAALAAALVRESIPFKVEPWPDDQWRFSTKAEHARRLTGEEVR